MQCSRTGLVGWPGSQAVGGGGVFGVGWGGVGALGPSAAGSGLAALGPTCPLACRLGGPAGPPGSTAAAGPLPYAPLTHGAGLLTRAPARRCLPRHRPEQWGYLHFLAEGQQPQRHPRPQDPALAARRAVMEVYHLQRDFRQAEGRFAATVLVGRRPCSASWRWGSWDSWAGMEAPAGAGARPGWQRCRSQVAGAES
jgi:hypothetical protein